MSTAPNPNHETAASPAAPASTPSSPEVVSPVPEPITAPVPSAENPPAQPQPELTIGPDHLGERLTSFEQPVALEPGTPAVESPAASTPVDDPFAALNATPDSYDPFVDPPRQELPWEKEAAATGAPTDAGAAPGSPSILTDVPAAPVITRAQRNKQFARQAAKAQLHNMKKLLAPVCVCMAVLMYLLGSLAVLHLFGMHHMWGRRVDSTTWVLMSCWLVGAILTFGAIVFFRDVKAHELAQAEEEQARNPQPQPVPATPPAASTPSTEAAPVSPAPESAAAAGAEPAAQASSAESPPASVLPDAALAEPATPPVPPAGTNAEPAAPPAPPANPPSPPV